MLIIVRWVILEVLMSAGAFFGLFLAMMVTATAMWVRYEVVVIDGSADGYENYEESDVSRSHIRLFRSLPAHTINFVQEEAEEEASRDCQRRACLIERLVPLPTVLAAVATAAFFACAIANVMAAPEEEVFLDLARSRYL